MFAECSQAIANAATCALFRCEKLRWAICRTLGTFVTNDRKYRPCLIFVVHDTRGKSCIFSWHMKSRKIYEQISYRGRYPKYLLARILAFFRNEIARDLLRVQQRRESGHKISAIFSKKNWWSAQIYWRSLTITIQ
jgi:hypothetical protein